MSGAGAREEHLSQGQDPNTEECGIHSLPVAIWSTRVYSLPSMTNKAVSRRVSLLLQLLTLVRAFLALQESLASLSSTFSLVPPWAFETSLPSVLPQPQGHLLREPSPYFL